MHFLITIDMRRTIEDEVQRMITVLHKIDNCFEPRIGDFRRGITKENARGKDDWTDENKIEKIQSEEKIEKTLRFVGRRATGLIRSTGTTRPKDTPLLIIDSVDDEKRSDNHHGKWNQCITTNIHPFPNLGNRSH
jgi:hypothetical protein